MRPLLVEKNRSSSVSGSSGRNRDSRTRTSANDDKADHGAAENVRPGPELGLANINASMRRRWRARTRAPCAARDIESRGGNGRQVLVQQAQSTGSMAAKRSTPSKPRRVMYAKMASITNTTND